VKSGTVIKGIIFIITIIVIAFCGKKRVSSLVGDGLSQS